MPEKELGLLEVVFPEDVDEELALQFEKIFVSYGFLKTGLVSDADEYVSFSIIIYNFFSMLSYLQASKTSQNIGSQTEY